MDPILAALLGVTGGLVVCGVAWAIFYRRSIARPVTDVDELAVEVDRIGKLVRRLTMQRLRQDALDNPKPPAELLPAAPAAPVSPLTVKQELRRRYLGGSAS